MERKACYIANPLGDSEENPSETTMLRFLDAIDPSDTEHGAAWLTDEDANGLEFTGTGLLVFTREDRCRHLTGVTKEQALRLWQLLAGCRLDDLELEDWKPGASPPLSADERERLERERNEWQAQTDRRFYDLLGPEHNEELCRRASCTRGRVSQSVFCRVHHFESIWGRACPFDD